MFLQLLAVLLLLCLCASAVAEEATTQPFDDYVLNFDAPVDPALQKSVEKIDAEVLTPACGMTERSFVQGR